MAVLVDFRCVSCGVIAERTVTWPVPEVVACHACGGESRRRWTPVGIVSGRGGPSEAPPDVSTAALCAANPDVPGLCHMSPSAGRAWVARFRRDTRALDAELSRQEAAAAATPPTKADVLSHGHH
ncbi:hypothetical protein GCM10010988_39860 [Cnuibacter physcomitrellae]|nr:hypothetical protein GCM10010988_39860 [Cnuibacter physcomitrellae]